MSRISTAWVSAMLLSLCAVTVSGLTHRAAAQAGESATPSPGPIATVEPVPCTAAMRPTRIAFVLETAPEGHVPLHHGVRQKDRVLQLYHALCKLPPVDLDSVTCSFSTHEVVYSTELFRGATRTILLALNLGGCQLATLHSHGYVAAYRIPRKVVALIAHLLHVPSARLMPPKQ